MTAKSRWQDWLSLVVGLWLFFSPWILGVSGVGTVAWSAWILGVLVFAAAIWALAVPGSTVPEWCIGVLGVVVIVMPWLAGFASMSGPVWSFVVSGVIALGLAVWAARDIRAGMQMA